MEAIIRPHKSLAELNSVVQNVLADVRDRGDAAVREYEEKFDKVRLNSLKVTDEELIEAENLVSDELKEALELAHGNIKKFHEAQKFTGKKIETSPGVCCWQKAVPIEKVGLYIPGGTAPLFSTVLMLATPAKIAGCREIVLCSPPSHDGKINPAILYTAKMAGVNNIYKIGGVQAIGAMAYGTESVPKVYKIFGPGNQYVMAAKQYVGQRDVAIDMPAGPSEVAIIADDTANPNFVAADFLSQDEHGVDSQAVLVSTSKSMLKAVKTAVSQQLQNLPRKEIASVSVQNSRFVYADTMDEAIELINDYAPEHLIIATKDYMEVASKIVNAGSVFLGNYSCESAGDYASGTNHTLPTSGYAKAYSGVSLDSFIRKITFQELTADGIRHIGPAVALMAQYEHLDAHKRAMELRMKDVMDKQD